MRKAIKSELSHITHFKVEQDHFAWLVTYVFFLNRKETNSTNIIQFEKESSPEATFITVFGLDQLSLVFPESISISKEKTITIFGKLFLLNRMTAIVTYLSLPLCNLSLGSSD